MAIDITINGSFTLDESAGLQTGGVADPPEDNNDSDVTLATLQTDVASFYDRLFGIGELALDSGFATDNGVARSGSTYISLSGTGSVTTLGFVDSSGAALPIYGVDLVGAATNLTALDGGAITLFMDPASELGNRVAYGVDEDGDIVFAMFMEPAANLLSARVWMVQFEAMDNPDDTDHDDPLELTGLGVGAGASTEFNFDGLPSGANLFGMVGSSASGLVFFGATTVLKNDGTYKNPGSDVIQSSQAGPNATIGVNSQMFDPGESVYFTFVRNPDSNFTSFNLDPNEADDADNMLYGDTNGGTNDTIEAGSAFLKVAQIQSGTIASMHIDAFNISGSPQGRNLITASGQNAVQITRVIVYDSAGNPLDDSDDPAGDNPNISFDLSGNGATITGIEAGYTVEWYTDGVHDQVKVSGVTGKFDIGGFGVNEPSAILEPLTGVRFEDDGPDVDLALSGTADLTVDESTLPASASILASALLSTNTADFGTDGPGADDSVYELVLGDDNSGLFDTATGDEVLLSINGDGTLITGSVEDGGAQTVFTIAIDPDTGEVTVTQSRAMVHGDATDPDEEDTPLTLAAGLVSVRRTITDGDDDSDSDTVDISSIFNFEDAGPTQPPAGEDVGNLVTDDTLVTDSVDVSTDDIFPDAPNYGSDGPHAVTPLIFSLRLDDPVPGDGDDPDSGLIDTETGDSIRFVTVGNDIVGYVDSDGDGVIEAGETLEAVRYSLVAVDSDSFDVTFTQTRAVFHALADTEETVAANTIFVERAAIDGDGDPAEVVDFDLGAITFLLDDEPTIGPISDGLVDFALNDFVTNPLNGDVGNDPNSSPYVLTSFTPSVVVNGVTVTGVLSGDSTSVTYWANTNGNGVIGDAGDTAYYELELGDQGGAGDYTFTVLLNPPPSFTEFTFDLLPSGANLFGVVTSGNSALLVMGEDPAYNADGNYTNASDVIHTSQGGDGATIGVNNQMFDPGDGAYFTYINDPDPNFISGAPGGLTATEADNINNVQYNEDGVGPATTEVMSAFLGISQTQSNKPVSMTIEAFNIAGGPQEEAFDAALGTNHVDITAVRVFNADGDDVTASVSITIDADGVATVGGLLRGYTVEWDTAGPHDQVLITGATGKFDVGRFGFNQGNDTPDQLLSFTAQVTDGDGDFASASWDIGIDGTGVHDDGIVAGISII